MLRATEYQILVQAAALVAGQARILLAEAEALVTAVASDLVVAYFSLPTLYG